MIGLKSISKKGLGIILSAVMMVSMMPVPVFANYIEFDNYLLIGDQDYDFPDKNKTVYVTAYGADARVTGGSITANSNKALYVGAKNINEATVIINGDVDNNKQEGVGVGVDILATTEGEADVTVNGSVSGPSRGVAATSTYGGTSDITVTGDVTSKSVGAFVDVYGDGETGFGTASVWVDGTITGDKIGVGIRDRGETREGTMTVTAWQITPNEEGWIAGYIEGENSLAGRDENFEQNNINYIIKLEQPAEGTAFKAIDGDNVTVNNGDARKEMTRISLEALPGFEITGAFNGNGEKVPLSIGADGKYYIEVPKGGGVYLTVTVGSKAKYLAPQPTTTDGSDNSVGKASLSASIAQMITEAAQGATVRVTITNGSSLCKMAVDALETRPDVTLVVDYAVNGGMYETTIPGGIARPDLVQYKNAAGGIDFETLTVHFGGKQIF